MTCSDLWQQLPAWGTAPEARFWVALEQPGAWGAKALTQSELDPALGKELSSIVEDAGGRIVLVRDPWNHRAGAEAPRTVFVAHGGEHWLGRARIDDPAALPELLRSWVATAPDAMPDWLEPCAPVLLVCSNGKRDQCCAVKARPVLRALPADLQGRVWECSHLNGHRFATTALALPSSQLVARLDADLASRLLADAGPLPLGEQHDRGLTCLPEAQQVADALVRSRMEPQQDPSLHLEGPDQEGSVTVHSRSTEQTWRVRVQRQQLGEELPKSCGKPAEPAVVWRAELV